MKSPLEALPAQLGELMLRDQQRLRRRLQGARKIKNPDAQLAVAAEVESDIAAARQKCRRAPRLARALPIRKACRSAKKQDILNAIRDHGGDRRRGNRLGENHPAAEDLSGTGARGERPDRPYPAAPPAARTVANRIADELETPLGGSVGYKVRFNDQVGTIPRSS